MPELLATGAGGIGPARAAIAAWQRDGWSPGGVGGSTVDVAEVGDPEGRPIGLLVVGFTSSVGRRRTARGELMAAMARHLGTLLAMYERRAPAGDAYAALLEIGTQIQAAESDVDAVFDLIVDKARELLGTDIAWLALVDDGHRVEMAVAKGIHTEAFLRMHVDVGEGIGGVALRRGRPIVVRDYDTYSSGTPGFVRDAVLAEGVSSVICAPLQRDGQMVGALYVANRQATAFDDSDSSLLAALAAQASVAIVNARLYHELEKQHALLEHSFSIHRELTEAGLRGAGLSGIGEALAGLLGLPVVVEQQIVLPASVRSEAGVATDGDEAAADPPPIAARAPIAVGREQLGRLTVLGASELTAIQRKAVEHGITVLALELVKLRAARDVEWRLQGELLQELLESGDPVPEPLALRGRRIGVDVRARHRVLVVEPDGGAAEDQAYGALLPAVRTAVAAQSTAARSKPLTVKRGSRVVVAIGEELEASREAIVAAIQAASRSTGSTVSVGSSALRHDFAVALRDATACAALCRRAGAAETMVAYEDLGALRFLLDAPDLEHATSVVHERLGPVLEHDRGARTPLLATLRAYLDADGHQATAAASCYIHVSTLKYRVGRLNDVLGASLADPSLRFDLRLALQLLDLLEALEIDLRRGLPTSSR